MGNQKYFVGVLITHTLSYLISQNCVICLSLSQPQAGSRVSTLTGSDLKGMDVGRCSWRPLWAQGSPLGREAPGTPYAASFVKPQPLPGAQSQPPGDSVYEIPLFHPLHNAVREKCHYPTFQMGKLKFKPVST